MLACSFVGSHETVRRGLQEFLERTNVEELIVASAIFDHTARLHSYEILMDAVGTKPQRRTKRRATSKESEP